jgi:maltose phosphorylase
MAKKEIGAISYSIKSINFEGRISFTPIIDAEIKDEQLDSYQSQWNVLQTKTQQDVAHLWNQIKLKDFHVCSAMSFLFYKNNELLKAIPTKIEKEKIAGFSVGCDVRSGDTVCLNKYVAILSSLKHPRHELTSKACEIARYAKQKGWNQLFEEHSVAWNEKWLQAIIVETDVVKQQEMIFQTFQSF